METAIVSLMCMALIVFGGMTMSQGFLTSSDTTALSMEEISVRDGEIMRTEPASVGATGLSWANTLRIMVENRGQIKLASFSKWDVIVQYYDGSGNYYTKWLPYTSGTPGNNEWRKTAIYVNGQPEVFEPGILNPGEEMVIDANLNPSPQEGTVADVTIATPKGVKDSISLTVDYPILTLHSETPIIAGVKYYRLKEGTSADGTAMTETTDSFGIEETGRKIMHKVSDASRPARHIYPLMSIQQIPASRWYFYYRVRTWGDSGWPERSRDVNVNVDFLVRKADGTIRETIATRIASADITAPETWQTISATYNFRGYTVVDETDYLEIVYYGRANKGPENSSAYIQLRVDDNSLPEADQTRVGS